MTSSIPPRSVTISWQSWSISSNAAVGDYDVYVGLPDAFTTTASNARFAVRFANADDASKNQAWDASIGRFRTGTSLAVQ